MSTEHERQHFTDAEVRDQAMTNATACGLALLVYAREHGEAPTTAAHWLGRLFAPGWERVRGQGAYQVARLAALNFVSLGATLQALAGDEQRAVATLAGWPPDEILRQFEVSRAEAGAAFTIMEPIAEFVGLRYRWVRQGDAVTMAFE
jgi:hypothetical protein